MSVCTSHVLPCKIARIAKLLPSRLCGCEGFCCAVPDHASFKLGNSDHLLEQEATGRALDGRKVAEPNVNTGFKQLGEERHRARESRDVGDQECASDHTGTRKRVRQFRTAVGATAFNLNELGRQMPRARLKKSTDGFALRFKPEPGLALPIRADAIICDEGS